jgi:hypothetical protein
VGLEVVLVHNPSIDCAPYDAGNDLMVRFELGKNDKEVLDKGVELIGIEEMTGCLSQHDLQKLRVVEFPLNIAH